MMILYFFLEHVQDIIEPSETYDDQYPRFARWKNFSKLQIPKYLKTNKKIKVTISLEAENKREETLLELGDYIAEGTMEDTPAITIEAALVELQMTRARISSLEAENLVLRNEIETIRLGRQHEQDGDAYKEITPPNAEITPPNANIGKEGVVEDNGNKTTSFGKNLKARKGKRKQKRISNYVYELGKKKDKKHEERKTPEMIDIENSDEEWTEVKHLLPVIKDSEYWKYIPDDEKDKIENFFKNEFTSSHAYHNENTYLSVTGEDLWCLMFDGFIGGKIIDWFTEDNGTNLQFSPKLEAVYFNPYL